MSQNWIDLLEEKYDALQNKKITVPDYYSLVENALPQVQDFDGVETLCFFAQRDNHTEGIAVSKRIVKASVGMRSKGKLSGITRNGNLVSETGEYLLLAKIFARFDSPNDKDSFLEYFNRAERTASTCFDFELLASGLAAACRDFEDEALDPGMARTRAFIDKGLALALETKEPDRVDALAVIAEYDLMDMKLAKSLKDAKKKMK
jgi:hypothetical protein